MGTSSTTAGNAGLDAVLNGVTHVSLHTSDPGTTGANEATGNGYARQAVTLSAASSKASTNSADVVWTASGGTLGGGTVSHYGLWDSVSGGNFRYGGPLAASRTVADTETLTIATGNLDVDIS